MYYELTDRFEVTADIDRCWQFFTGAANLPKITPPWLKLTIDMPRQPVIQLDTILNYTIAWKGLPMRWRTRIIDLFPKRQFIDLQIHGPYALWHHQHTFEPQCGGGVICYDRVIYKLPVSIFGRAVHAMIVKDQLSEIFRFRRKLIGEYLGWSKSRQQDVQIATFK